MIYFIGGGREDGYAGATVNTIAHNTFAGNYCSDMALLSTSDTHVHHNTITGTKSTEDFFNGGIYVSRPIFVGSSPAGANGADRNLIEDNIITDLIKDAYVVSPPGWEGSPIRIDVDADSNIIQRNTLGRVASGLSWDFNTRGYGMHIENASDNNIVRENVVFDVTESCFLDGSNSTPFVIGNDYLNNVGYDCGKTGIALMKSNGATVRNNIFAESDALAYMSICAAGGTDSCSPNACPSAGGGGNTLSDNLYWKAGATGATNINAYSISGCLAYQNPNRTLTTWNSSTGESDSILDDPDFVNPTNPTRNFHLQTTSPACGQAFGGGNIGAYPAETCSGDSTPPAPPTGLTVTVNASHQITLTWTQGTDAVGVTQNKIYWCTGAACTPATPITISAATSYVHRHLTGGTIYRFQVSALDAALNESTLAPTPTPASATTEASGLVGHWPCNEASGNCLDQSGYSQPAVLSGNATRTTGLVGANALLLDGTSDFATVTGTTRLSPTVAWAMSACVKTATTDSNSSEVMSRGDSATMRIRPAASGGGLRCIRRSGGIWNQHDTSGFNLLDNLKRHVVCQYSGAVMEAYVDGNPAGSTAMSGTVQYDQGANLMLGAHGNGETIEDFNGTLDEMKFYDRVLSPAEITAEATTCLTTPATSDLAVSHYRLHVPGKAENTEWVMSEDGSRRIRSGGSTRFRFQILNTGSTQNQTFPLACNTTAAPTYTVLTSDCSTLGVCLKPGEGLAHTTPLPRRLTLPGGATYVSGPATMSTAWLSLTTNLNEVFEVEYGDIFVEGLTPGTVVCCRPVKGDSSPLDTYPTPPGPACLTVSAGSLVR